MTPFLFLLLSLFAGSNVQSFPYIFPTCLRANMTWPPEGEKEVILGVPKPELCQEYCRQENTTCQGVTWLDSNFPVHPQSCTLFSELGAETSCSNCVSGKPRCTCSLPGECAMEDHNVVGLFSDIETIEQCSFLCEEEKTCQFYTYFGPENPLRTLCILLNSCPEFTDDCIDCYFGKSQCLICPFSEMNPDGTCGLTEILIQRRGQYGNPKDFFSSKLWADYRDGFGDKDKEFWLGLTNIASLTSSSTWELRVNLVDFEGNNYTAVYNKFKVAQEEPFKLTVTGYDEARSNLQDSLSYHDQMYFSTKDNDNDKLSSNCASDYLGAWWYRSCWESTLNGFNFNDKYDASYQVIGWNNEGNVAEQTQHFSWPFAEMKIIRTS